MPFAPAGQRCALSKAAILPFCRRISNLTRNPLAFRISRQPKAGIAQLVEHDLAKVGVASSSLVSRSNSSPPFFCYIARDTKAGWQSGHAADCNSAYAGSIPTPASKQN